MEVGTEGDRKFVLGMSVKYGDSTEAWGRIVKMGVVADAANEWEAVLRVSYVSTHLRVQAVAEQHRAEQQRPSNSH